MNERNTTTHINMVESLGYDFYVHLDGVLLQKATPPTDVPGCLQGDVLKIQGWLEPETVEKFQNTDTASIWVWDNKYEVGYTITGVVEGAEPVAEVDGYDPAHAGQGLWMLHVRVQKIVPADDIQRENFRRH